MATSAAPRRHLHQASHDTQAHTTPGAVIGIAAIVVSAIFFVVPFVFILLIASKPSPRRPARVLLAVELRPVRQPGAGVRRPRLPDGHRLHQQRDPHRGQRRRDGHLQRHGRLRLAAPSQSAQPRDQRPDPGRADRAARHRAHHLGAAGPGLFKTMPGLILIEIASGCRSASFVPRLHVTVPRELDEAAVVDGAGPCRSSSGIFPILRSVIMTVIILQSVFVYNDSSIRSTSSRVPRTPPSSSRCPISRASSPPSTTCCSPPSCSSPSRR